MVTSYSYGPRASGPHHGWERATPVALMGCVIHKDAPLEWRAPSKEADLRRSALQSVVELRSLLRRLEEFRIVADEELGVLDIADVPDLIVALVGIARALRAGNRRDQVLVEALLQVDHVAGQDRAAGLGQLDHHELAARRVARCTNDAHRAVVEQVEVAVQPDRLHVLGLGEIARDVVDRETDIGPPRRLELVVLRDQGRVLELP